jgi:hypothetical protein
MTDRAPTSAGGRNRRAGVVAAAFAVDSVLVVLFALTGRASHAEGLDAAGVWTTAWPFLAGLVTGWLVTRAWRHPLAPWPTGVLTWAATLGLGMLLRLASGQGIAMAFVIVAAITLGLLLIGWRAVASAMSGIRRRRGSAAATGATSSAGTRLG